MILCLFWFFWDLREIIKIVFYSPHINLGELCFGHSCAQKLSSGSHKLHNWWKGYQILTNQYTVQISNSDGCKLMGFTCGKLEMPCHLTKKIWNKGHKGHHPPTLFSPSINNILTDDVDCDCPPISSATKDCEQLRKAFAGILSSSFQIQMIWGSEFFSYILIWSC